MSYAYEITKVLFMAVSISIKTNKISSMLWRMNIYETVPSSIDTWNVLFFSLLFLSRNKRTILIFLKSISKDGIQTFGTLNEFLSFASDPSAIEPKLYSILYGWEKKKRKRNTNSSTNHDKHKQSSAWSRIWFQHSEHTILLLFFSLTIDFLLFSSYNWLTFFHS